MKIVHSRTSGTLNHDFPHAPTQDKNYLAWTQPTRYRSEDADE